MKKLIVILLSFFVLVLVVWSTGCHVGEKSQIEASEVAGDTAMITRGRYLVGIGGCGDCHSSKTFSPEGMFETPESLLGGYQPGDSFEIPAKSTIGKGLFFNHKNTAFAGPWGISYAANLTSDASGIGTWTYTQFEVAMRKGKFKGMEEGRPLLPPMPWQNYIHMSDADMRAIFAYLKSTDPVKNIVPAPLPPDAFK